MPNLLIQRDLSIPLSELEFVTSRSSGPGGQNVNKLETRVEIRFDIGNSRSLSEEQKALIHKKLRGRIDRNGVLRMVSQESRSQWKNKQIALEHLADLLKKALRPSKKRMRTYPSAASQRRRLEAKRRRSELKRLRHRSDE
jgi:ribosome-associated protein